MGAEARGRCAGSRGGNPSREADMRAYEMRRQGRSYEYIAAALGVSAGEASAMVRRVRCGRWGDVA